MKAIVNGEIWTPLVCLRGGFIQVQDDRVTRLEEKGAGLIPAGVERLEASGKVVLPGLVDLHTYGCLGVQLGALENVARDLNALARNVTRFGVTSFLISPPMGSPGQIREMLSALAEAIPTLQGGARCLGIHLEGPYLDPAQRGAFPRDVLREPSLSEMQEWVDAARGYLRMVTLAPNLTNSREVATFLQARGILASLGHTSAGFEEAQSALKPYGPFGVVTHLFNAMTGLHHRRPGAAGAALLAPVPAMLICDGEHVHPDVVELIVRCKSSQMVILVTDSIAGAGMPDGMFELFGQTVQVEAGRATLPEGGLAGSVLTLNRAVVNAARYAQLDLGRAAQMATINPACLLGLPGGRLECGARADLTILDPATGEVELTMVAGEIVWRRPQG